MAGNIFVIAGPSGAGKDTIIQLLQQQLDISSIVTVTTRKPRVGEINGVHYRFLTLHEYKKMLDDGDLLENANVHGNWYGVPADSVRELTQQGKDVIIRVDIEGAKSIKQKLPQVVLIFIRPGSIEELRNRLIHRASEDQETLAIRLNNAAKEIQSQQWFDYIVDNPDGHIDNAVSTVKDIILRRYDVI